MRINTPTFRNIEILFRSIKQKAQSKKYTLFTFESPQFPRKRDLEALRSS